MTALFFLLLVLGAVAYFVGWIWTVIVAFKSETRWGWLLLMPTLISWPLSAAGVHSLGGLMGLASLALYIAFLTKYWSVAKQPFLCTMGGIATMVCAAVIGFSALAARFQEAAATAAQTPAQSSEQGAAPAAPGSPEVSPPEQPIRPPSVQRIARQLPPPARPSRLPAPLPQTAAPAAAAPVPALRAEAPEPAPSPVPRTVAAAGTLLQPPVTINCSPVQYDPSQSLQVVTLSLSNSSPKAVASVRMKLVYFDKTGEKLGEWITERQLDESLEPSRTAEILQPAYHLPSLTKTVKVESRSVRFADRTQWPLTR